MILSSRDQSNFVNCGLQMAKRIDLRQLRHADAIAQHMSRRR
jgi:hypothetical protein